MLNLHLLQPYMTSCFHNTFAALFAKEEAEEQMADMEALFVVDQDFQL